MTTQRSGQAVLPQRAASARVSERAWLADPTVRATSEASKQARRAWMKMAPPENWLLRDLDPIQLEALMLMLETDAAYRAAKTAANAALSGSATGADTRS